MWHGGNGLTMHTPPRQWTLGHGLRNRCNPTPSIFSPGHWEVQGSALGQCRGRLLCSSCTYQATTSPELSSYTLHTIIVNRSTTFSHHHLPLDFLQGLRFEHGTLASNFKSHIDLEQKTQPTQSARPLSLPHNKTGCRELELPC